MLAFSGTHGTDRAAAVSILDKGFKARPGRIGPGAYFWSLLDDDYRDVAYRLAHDWATVRRKLNANRVKVIKASIQLVDDSEQVSLDIPLHATRLRMLMERFTTNACRAQKLEDVSRDEARAHFDDLGGLVEVYVKALEAELQSSIKVVFKSQYPAVLDPIREVAGLVSCFVVRDTSCIAKTELIKQEV